MEHSYRAKNSAIIWIRWLVSLQMNGSVSLTNYSIPFREPEHYNSAFSMCLA